jgi:hypothetical protein
MRNLLIVMVERRETFSSANTNSVSTLDSAFADPDMETMRQKLNEMILNGRR